jgi:antitoxin HigA-1
MDIDHLGYRVRRARLDQELTLVDVARKTQASVSFVSDVEQGRRTLSPATAIRFAEALGEDPTPWVERVLQERLDRAGVRYRVRLELKP